MSYDKQINLITCANYVEASRQHYNANKYRQSYNALTMACLSIWNDDAAKALRIADLARDIARRHLLNVRNDEDAPGATAYEIVYALSQKLSKAKRETLVEALIERIDQDGKDCDAEPETLEDGEGDEATAQTLDAPPPVRTVRPRQRG